MNLRLDWYRGLLVKELAQRAIYGAEDMLANVYAEAIKRNARLRARYRRWEQKSKHGARWPNVVRQGRSMYVSWGYDFSRGREPSCYVYGPKLVIGILDMAPGTKIDQVGWSISMHRGDLPCCVCPADVIMRCLTHWHLYHNGYAQCFRCSGHTAATQRRGFYNVDGPLWEGRKTPGRTVFP